METFVKIVAMLCMTGMIISSTVMGLAACREKMETLALVCAALVIVIFAAMMMMMGVSA